MPTSAPSVLDIVPDGDQAACETDCGNETVLCKPLEPDTQVFKKYPSADHGLPPEKIGFQCGSCKSEVAIYVENAGDYTEDMLIQIFKGRGSSYKPPLCGHCKRKK